MTPQKSKSLCLRPHLTCLTDISFAWRINWQSIFMNRFPPCRQCLLGTHWMFYASVKARIDWHGVNSGFACMSCLVTLMGHRFLFERDTLLSLFMFAILVRSYSLQYNQHKCVKISLLNLLHSKVWIHADPQQTVFPRTTALPLVFQCNFGGLDKMSKCKVIMIYVKDSVTSLPILRLIKSSTRVSVKFVQDGSCRDIW